ncbi:MAG: hypothetical protein WA629_05275 [Candidatus Aquilonibacter sp.]
MIGTTTRVRSFNVVQLALMAGVLYALLGVIAGFFEGLAAMTAGSFFSGYGMPSFGPLSIVLFPILFAVFLFVAGFLYGLIGGALYNLVAGWIGGVEVQLETRV